MKDILLLLHVFAVRVDELGVDRMALYKSWSCLSLDIVSSKIASVIFDLKLFNQWLLLGSISGFYSFYLVKWQNLVMGFLRIEFLLWFMIRALFFWSNVRIFNSFLPRSCVLHIIEFLHRLLNIFLSHIFRSHFTLSFNC